MIARAWNGYCAFVGRHTKVFLALDVAAIAYVAWHVVNHRCP